MEVTSRQTIKTRILIISDTHTATPYEESNTEYAFRWPLPRADVLLHAGDLTGNGAFWQHKRTAEMIRKAPAKLKIVIPGNHDLTLDEEYYPKHWEVHGKVSGRQDMDACKYLYTGVLAEEAGIVYMEEGIRTFVLDNGAKLTVYASAYTPAFFNWAFAYDREDDRFNYCNPESKLKAINPVPEHGDIDVMLTHGPPQGFLDETKHGAENVGCEHLFYAVKRCQPRLHAFGHIHEGWGAMRVNWDLMTSERINSNCEMVVRAGAAFIDISHDGDMPLEFGKDTLFVNAAIMDLLYDPTNAPWVVDLDLPLAMP